MHFLRPTPSRQDQAQLDGQCRIPFLASVAVLRKYPENFRLRRSSNLSLLPGSIVNGDEECRAFLAGFDTASPHRPRRYASPMDNERAKVMKNYFHSIDYEIDQRISPDDILTIREQIICEWFALGKDL